MPAESLKPALRAALRMHEIGNGTPYEISFAGKGNSGGSFGSMQGDLAAGQAVAKKTFVDCLTAAGVPKPKIDQILAAIAVPVKVNPLSQADTDLVNAALRRGSALVDAMDEAILAGIYPDVDTCTSAAASAGRTIAPRALLYMALWINMTGKPTKLRDWLRGVDVGIPQPGPVVDAAAIETYLLAQKYYIEHKANFPHMRKSVETGAALLP